MYIVALFDNNVEPSDLSNYLTIQSKSRNLITNLLQNTNKTNLYYKLTIDENDILYYNTVKIFNREADTYWVNYIIDPNECDFNNKGFYIRILDRANVITPTLQNRLCYVYLKDSVANKNVNVYIYEKDLNKSIYIEKPENLDNVDVISLVLYIQPTQEDSTNYLNINCSFTVLISKIPFTNETEASEQNKEEYDVSNYNDMIAYNLINNNKLSAKNIIGPINKTYTAVIEQENWTKNSYYVFDDINVEPLDEIYITCSECHAIGLRLIYGQFFDANNQSIKKLSINKSNLYVNDTDGFKYYVSVPYGAVKFQLEINLISNAITAGETNEIGEEFYIKNLFVIVNKDLHTFLNNDWKQAINYLQTNANDKFCFGIQSDTHFAMLSDTVGYNLAEATKYFGFDFIANLGDITRGYSGGTNGIYDTDSMEGMKYYAKHIMYRYTNEVKCPFLVAVGNHEYNILYKNNHPEQNERVFTESELFTLFIRQCYNTSARIDGVYGKQYYYLDSIAVRVIVLDTNDTNGSFNISNEQTQWFINTALNTSKPVLVLSHVPLIQEVSINYSSTYANIVTALQEFKSNGGRVIACLNGHVHKQDAIKLDGIWYISCTLNESNADTVEFFMVDLNNFSIETIGIGNASSRSFEY